MALSITIWLVASQPIPVNRKWLRCVPLIKGFDHLAHLCGEFESWYNTWRPHRAIEVLRPDDLYYDRKPEEPKRDAKTIPDSIERHVFAETRLPAYRLKTAAWLPLRGLGLVSRG